MKDSFSQRESTFLEYPNTMKMNDKCINTHRLSAEHVKMLREQAVFHELWIQPLLAAGATLEIAITAIVESHFRPN